MTSSLSGGRKGRRMGFKLSEASKRSISESKRGQKHKESTKEKISKSLQNYFRKKFPLSEEITNIYCRVDDEGMCDWLYEVSDELDECRDILTQKVMYGKLRVEISYGDNIEEIFSHSITPEFLLILKQELDSRGEIE